MIAIGGKGIKMTATRPPSYVAKSMHFSLRTTNGAAE
jgi:hypothetical protein